MQHTISRTETTLLGLRRCGVFLTKSQTSRPQNHFPHLTHLKLILSSGAIQAYSHSGPLCGTDVSDVSAATEAWSCDAARAVSGHGYQFCRELRAATTSPATRQWYSPEQRWEVTCGSRGEMAGGKKGKREVRWRMMKDHYHIRFIEAYSATCMVGQPRIHTHEKNERFWLKGSQLTCFCLMDSNDCWIINWYQLDAIRVQLADVIQDAFCQLRRFCSHLGGL